MFVLTDKNSFGLAAMLISPAHINAYIFKSWWQLLHPIPNIFLTSSIFFSQSLKCSWRTLTGCIGIHPPAWELQGDHLKPWKAHHFFQQQFQLPILDHPCVSLLHYKNGIMILNLSLGIWFLVFLGTTSEHFSLLRESTHLPLSYYLAQDCSQLPVNTEKHC